MKFSYLTLLLFMIMIGGAKAADSNLKCEVTGSVPRVQEEAIRFCQLFEIGLPKNCSASVYGQLIPNGGSVVWKDSVLVIKVNDHVCRQDGLRGWNAITNKSGIRFEYVSPVAESCGKIYCATEPETSVQPTTTVTRVCEAALAEGVSQEAQDNACDAIETAVRQVDPTCSYSVDMNLERARYGGAYVSRFNMTVNGKACQLPETAMLMVSNAFTPVPEGFADIGRECAKSCSTE